MPDQLSLKHPPREWQKAALRAWRSARRRGIAEVVTGAGKTVFAQVCMMDTFNVARDIRFVIVVPTLALIDQWHVSLTEDLGVRPTDIATYSGLGHPEHPALVNLLALPTARDVAPGIGGRSSTPAMLIVDECHRAASKENSRALAGNYEATLGLSATPKRDYDTGLDDVLIPRLGPIVYTYDYNQAVRDQVIVPFDLVNVSVELSASEATAYDKLSRQVAILLGRQAKGELVDDRLTPLLRKRARVSGGARMRIPVAASLALQHPDDSVLIFHEQIAAAEEIAALLTDRGVSTVTYHSRISPEVRRDNLRQYRNGVFRVLVSCRALDEGVNLPETAVAIVASSTASTRQRIQRLGRVLRPAMNKSRALIYTIYATVVEEERLVRESARLTEAASVDWRRGTVVKHQ